MLQKNPDQMKEIVDFADRFYARHRRSPSVREIAAGTTLKRSSVHNYLVAMNDNGMIVYNGQTIETPYIRALQQEMRRIGIVGSVSCGLPTDASVQQDEYLNLPLTMVGNDDVYILYASGDSMIGAGIEDGDMVLVRRQETANDGEIVVAYVEGEGNTLKRLRHDGNQIILHPENPDLHDIQVDFLKIQGVAVWVFKNLNNQKS